MQVVDHWLERGVQQAYEEKHPLCLVILGILAIQQAFGLSGPPIAKHLACSSWTAIPYPFPSPCPFFCLPNGVPGLGVF